MKIINQDNTIHTLLIVPRKPISGGLTLIIEDNPQEVIYVQENERITLQFEFLARKDQEYSFKLVNDNEIIYRGLLFATSEQPQNYEQTKGIFYFGG